MEKVTDLSDEDKKRIQDSDFYLHAKKIMRSFNSYNNIQVGEVYSISFIGHNGKVRYVKRGGSRALKDKFLVFHKDEGFIFAKRINASGDLSKEVVCLTIRYPSESYTLELDADQAEFIIFQDETSFDPFKEGKELSKKKNKARRLNKPKIIKYETAQEAFNFVSTLKKGDKLFDADTSFGDGIVQWEVTQISHRITDKTPMTDWNGSVYAYGNTDIDQKHYKNNINTVISVEISMVGEPPSSRKWISKRRDVCFVDFLSSTKHRDYYSSAPITIEEV